jgi:hypothetical protein
MWNKVALSFYSTKVAGIYGINQIYAISSIILIYLLGFKTVHSIAESAPDTLVKAMNGHLNYYQAERIVNSAQVRYESLLIFFNLFLFS